MESGNLAHKGVLSLLTELNQAKATGSLKLERAPLQKAVYLREGQILFAASNDPKDQLASILVEEGKLGPDQMQIAQARVSPGNPLAKVLTELGYITQRELADAARLKVEKILTDLFGWKEGNHQFAEGSLPKGAIDLELSTPRLMFNSIRRMQDREWVLQELGSLDTVYSPTDAVESFVTETEADAPTQDLLRFVDGVKTVKQIGALSTLSEFEVCKVLAAAQMLGAVRKADEAPPEPAQEDILSLSPDDMLPQGLEEPAAPEPMEQTILDTGPKPFSGLEQPPEPVPESLPPTPQMVEVPEPSAGPPPFVEPPPPAAPSLAGMGGDEAPSLLIDEGESEPSQDPFAERVPPRPRRMKEGAGDSKKKILVAVAGAVLLAGGIAAGYFFLWPMLFSGDGSSSETPTKAATAKVPTETDTSPPPPTMQPPTGPAVTKGQSGSTTPPAIPKAKGGETAPGGGSTAQTPTPPKVTEQRTTPTPKQTSPPPKAPTPKAATETPTPKKQTPPPQRPTPSPKTAQKGSSSSMARSQEFLQSGRIQEAANIHMQHLRATGTNKFTIAVGVYCDASNAGRAYKNSGNSEQLLVLPYTYRGRSCYRVFWGLFDSEETARRNVASLPTVLRSPDSVPVPVSDLIR